MLDRIGHEKEAIALYKKNLELGKHLPSTVNLSAIYLKHGERKQAIQLLRSATREFRYEAVPWYLLAKIASQNDNTSLADVDYQKALKADPLNGFAHIRYARFLALQGHFENALVHARRATRLLPHCAECFKILGNILNRKGSERQALAAYQKSAALAPKNDIYEQIADTFEKLGEKQRADNIRRAFQQLTPHRQAP